MRVGLYAAFEISATIRPTLEISFSGHARNLFQSWLLIDVSSVLTCVV